MKKTNEKLLIEIPSALQELVKIEQLSNDIAKKMDLCDDQKDNLAIAVTEAVGNAIVHGNKKDSSKTVSIEFILNPGSVTCTVKDQGSGFKIDELSNPLAPQNLMKESGRGIFILKALMDDVSYSFSPRGTTVTFTLRKKKQDE